MIPTQTNLTTTTNIPSSKTYKIDWENGRILSLGTCDGVVAAHQAIIKNIETERYAYPIYDGTYGVGMETYIAKDFDYISMELERNTREALLVDDRNVDILDFKITEFGLDSCDISYTVLTVYGQAQIRKVL